MDMGVGRVKFRIKNITGISFAFEGHSSLEIYIIKKMKKQNLTTPPLP
jgi:hypothetical protein